MDEKENISAVQGSPSLSDDPSIKAVPTLLKGSVDPVYEAKAQTLNNAIQAIGMGRYQWQLFIVVGAFGWASDNMWPIITSLILPAVTMEFSPSKPPLLSLAQNIGLLAGAIFWGFGCRIATCYQKGNADCMKVTFSVDDGHLISPSGSPRSLAL